MSVIFINHPLFCNSSCHSSLGTRHQCDLPSVCMCHCRLSQNLKRRVHLIIYECLTVAYPILKCCHCTQRLTFWFRNFGFKTSANLLRVSVSENLVSEKSFGFGKFGLEKKSLGFGCRKFGLRKKSRFWFWKIWSRKRKNQSNKKETRPSKQCKSLI